MATFGNKNAPNIGSIMLRRCLRWFQPIRQILVKLDHFPKDRGKNKKSWKPAPMDGITSKQEKHKPRNGTWSRYLCPFSSSIADMFWGTESKMHITPPPRMIAVSTRNTVVLRIALRLFWRWGPMVCPLATESRRDPTSDPVDLRPP